MITADTNLAVVIVINGTLLVELASAGKQLFFVSNLSDPSETAEEQILIYALSNLSDCINCPIE
jgi:hypothetical protein